MEDGLRASTVLEYNMRSTVTTYRIAVRKERERNNLCAHIELVGASRLCQIQCHALRNNSGNGVTLSWSPHIFSVVIVTSEETLGVIVTIGDLAFLKQDSTTLSFVSFAILRRRTLPNVQVQLNVPLPAFFLPRSHPLPK